MPVPTGAELRRTGSDRGRTREAPAARGSGGRRLAPVPVGHVVSGGYGHHRELRWAAATAGASMATPMADTRPGLSSSRDAWKAAEASI